MIPAQEEISTRVLAGGPADRAAYIEFLGAAFGEPWTVAAFDFYLGRSFAGRASEVLVRTRNGRILAGLGVAHRDVRLTTGSETIRVAVLTAGGTLAAERRRGHYAALLDLMLHRARAAGCVAALGFVTRQNGSGRGLVRLGGRSVPSFYVTSASRGMRRGETRAAAPSSPERSSPRRRLPMENRPGRPAGIRHRAMLRRTASRAPAGANFHGAASFHYERDEDWLSQFVRRPNPVRLIRLAHDSAALVETVWPMAHRGARANARPVERLQWIGCPKSKMTANIAHLARASRAAGREFFMYTLDPLEAAAAKRAGLKVRGGYLMMLPIKAAGWDELLAASWRLQSGDRL
jgi:hypothetical protein